MAFQTCRACSKVTVSRVRPSCGSIAAPSARIRCISRPQVVTRFFKFGGAANPNLEGKPGNGRDFYRYADVDDYWNNMGFLAEEGGYDRMEALLEKHHPCDVMLLLAASENDSAKLEEVLKAWADVRAQDLDGKTALQLATKPAALAVLKAADAKLAAAA